MSMIMPLLLLPPTLWPRCCIGMISGRDSAVTRQGNDGPHGHNAADVGRGSSLLGVRYMLLCSIYWMKSTMLAANAELWPGSSNCEQRV